MFIQLNSIFNKGTQILTNLALGKYAFQSSSFYEANATKYWTAFFAVDGLNDNNSSLNRCSLTTEAGGQPNWIGVDLGQMFSFLYVVVYSGKSSLFLFFIV